MAACPAMRSALNMAGIRGVLKYSEPMAKHTSWRAGGAAEYFFKPADRPDLCLFMAQLPVDMPVFFIGLGSNLLVRDGGLKGIVIRTHNALSGMCLESCGKVYVEAGVACAQVARFTGRNDLVGAEFLAGIPGSMGGALAMNAGAFGGETWQLVSSVDLMCAGGVVKSVAASDFSPAYRSVEVPSGCWFIAAHLDLETGDAEVSRHRIARLLKKRNETQPVQSASAGSVFKNPPKDHAGRLIEAAGLKGHTIGGARVSEKHANFIVNPGDACAADIEALIKFVQQSVLHQFGQRLETEVRIVGEI